MDYQMPIIPETERLLFRQHVMADKEAYCAMEMDAEVRRYTGGYPRTREEGEKRFMAAVQPITGSLGMWATVLKAEGKYIGRCGIYLHFNNGGEPIPGEASLGLYFAPAYWGSGLATEAGKAFIDFGFNKLGIHRIVTMVDTRNAVSVRVMEKIGLQLVFTETGPRSFYHYALENPSK